jgi:hypothetical protein
VFVNDAGAFLINKKLTWKNEKETNGAKQGLG